MVTRRIVQINQHTSLDVVTRLETVDRAAVRCVDRNRRSARSAAIVAAVQRLDTTSDPSLVRETLACLSEEYEDRQGGRLIGLYAKCLLGHPYVDHRIDLSGSRVVEHYTATQDPPAPFRAARPLAANGAYLYVEVYDDGTIVAVRADGRPVV